jgi:AraC-like DNA-binding protein
VAAVNPGSHTVLRLVSDALPERDRLAVWRELYGREMLRLEHEPLDEMKLFRVDMTLRRLPDLGMVRADLSPLRVGRSRALIADGNDAVTFQIASAAGFAAQLGREVEVAAGAAIGLSNADVGKFDFPLGARVLALSLTRRMLAALVHDLEDALVQPVETGSEAVWLLKHYVDLLDETPTLSAPELIELSVTHVYDLVALSFGATRDAAELAGGRGVRAARLAAAKEFVSKHLHRQDLRASSVAAYLHVTPRYVQMLFESEGRSFSEFVLAKRLALAYRMLLVDPREKISAIAISAGFGDLSYFNRTFRRRFQRTPSEVRFEWRREASRR